MISVLKMVTPLALLMVFFVGNQVKADNKTGDVTSMVIEFPKGGTELTADMKKTVSKFIGDARGTGQVEDVHIAAWADQPKVGDKSLSDAQQELAEKRASNVRDYLKDQLKVDDVDTHNMAKNAKFLSSEDARVKGQKPAGHDRVAMTIQEKGKPQAAVLVVELKEVAD